MAKRVIKIGFYWEGYTDAIYEIINESGVCHCANKTKKAPNKHKIIFIFGILKRYQFDLWYIKGNLKANHIYEYKLDVMDHYKKWMQSYLLRNKSGELFLSKIKNFININAKCQILQKDNGLKFNNKLSKIYLENKGILYLRISNIILNLMDV